MSRSIGLIVCLLIMIMDIVAGILGIEAEAAQNKVKHVRVWIFECREPSHRAFKLGLAAAVLLALAHAISNLLGGCICIWSKDELGRASANKQLADYSSSSILNADHRDTIKL
ncbi:Protein DESIGUAL 2 [Sarracenia purpurea var. burkii]